MKALLTLTAAFLTLALSVVAADFPKGSPKFVTSYRQALSKAEKEGKPVVLVFSAAWCPPCQQMKKNVYPSAEVTPMHDKFVWAYLDVDEGDNSRAAENFSVSGIPHVEFLDASGKSLGKQVGGVTPAAFASLLKDVSDKAVKK